MATGLLAGFDAGFGGGWVGRDFDDEHRQGSAVFGSMGLQAVYHFLEDFEVGERLVPDDNLVRFDTFVRLGTQETVGMQFGVDAFGSLGFDMRFIRGAFVVGRVWVEHYDPFAADGLLQSGGYVRFAAAGEATDEYKGRM